MNFVSSLFFVALSFGIIGCSAVPELYGGDEGLAPILAPVKAEAYIVTNDPHSNEKTANKYLEYYVVAGPVVIEDKALLEELSDILSSDSSYNWHLAKACIFQPGIAIRFYGAKSNTEVVFCFKCNELKIYRGTKLVGGEDFDNAKDKLVKIMKQIFPKNNQVKNL